MLETEPTGVNILNKDYEDSMKGNNEKTNKRVFDTRSKKDVAHSVEERGTSSESEEDPFVDSGSDYIPTDYDSDKNSCFEEQPQSSKKLHTIPKQNIPENRKTNNSVTFSVSRKLEGKRLRDKKHSCYFCNKLLTSKMSRHFELVHSMEVEVANYLVLKKGSKSRRDALVKIIRSGDFYHNLNVLTMNEGEIILVRRPCDTDEHFDYKDFAPCTHCLGFMQKRYLYLHFKKCKANLKKEQRCSGRGPLHESSAMLYEIMGPRVNENFRLKIVNSFQVDEIGTVCKNDILILTLGGVLYEKYGVSQADLVRQSMRQLARLKMELEKQTNIRTSLGNWITLNNFDNIIAATKAICGNNSETEDVRNRNDFQMPSLALKIKHLLRKCLAVESGSALRAGLSARHEDLKAFSELIDLEWTLRISSKGLQDLPDHDFDENKESDEELEDKEVETEEKKTEQVTTKEDLGMEIVDLESRNKQNRSGINKKLTSIPDKRKCVMKRPWNLKETGAVLKFFSKNIKTETVPIKAQCEQCIKRFDVLNTRNWKSIKFHVKNIIARNKATLKRSCKVPASAKKHAIKKLWNLQETEVDMSDKDYEDSKKENDEKTIERVLDSKSKEDLAPSIEETETSSESEDPCVDNGSDYIPTDTDSEKNSCFEEIDQQAESSKKLHTISKQNTPENRKLNNVADSVTFSVTKKLEGKLLRDKKHSCYFCNKLIRNNMSRHFEVVHSKEVEVANYLVLKKGSKARRDALGKIIRSGDFYHNLNVLTMNEGEIILVRRPCDTNESFDYKDFAPCTHCLGFMQKRYLSHHFKRCKANLKKDQRSRRGILHETSAMMYEIMGPRVNENFRLEIINSFKLDEIGTVCKNDNLILTIGGFLYEKHGVSQAELVRQSMRQLARLKIELEKQTNIRTSLGNWITPNNFDNIIVATKAICGNDSETEDVRNQNDFQMPSLALKIKLLLRKCVAVESGSALRAGLSARHAELKAFSELIDLEWTLRISSKGLQDLPDHDVVENKESDEESEDKEVETEEIKAQVTTKEDLGMEIVEKKGIQQLESYHKQNRSGRNENIATIPDKRKCLIKRPWNVQETGAVLKFFKHNIKTETVPGKTQCEQCIKRFDVLNTRDWRSIKFHVKNIIARNNKAALKRTSKLSATAKKKYAIKRPLSLQKTGVDMSNKDYEDSKKGNDEKTIEKVLDSKSKEDVDHSIEEKEIRSESEDLVVDSGSDYIPTDSDSDKNSCFVEIDQQAESSKKLQCISNQNTPENCKLNNVAGSVTFSVTKKLEGKLLRDKKHSCYFCNKLIRNSMSRHFQLVHSKEVEVANYLVLKKGSRPRRDALGKIIRSGDFYHNLNVLTMNEGEIILVRRPCDTNDHFDYKDFAPCTHCLGFMQKRYLYLHFKKCKANLKKDQRCSGRGPLHESSAMLYEIMGPRVNENFRLEIINSFQFDEIGTVCKNDILILTLGGVLYEKYGVSQAELIRQSMRQLARLKMELEKQTNIRTSLGNWITPNNFDKIIAATKAICGNNSETKDGRNRNDFQMPSLALKIKQLLRKCVAVESGSALRAGLSARHEELKAFSELIDLEWTRRISSKGLQSDEESEGKEVETEEINPEQVITKEDLEMEIIEIGEIQHTESNNKQNKSEINRKLTSIPDKRKCSIKRPWNSQETGAVLKFFKSNIETETVPGKAQCEQCIKTFDVLNTRDWKSIKFHVKNLITRIKAAPKSTSQVPVSAKKKWSIKRPWNLQETRAVLKFFKDNIKTETVPGKAQCEQCINKCDALNTRDWKSIKFHVKNLITQNKKTCKV